ncbi:MAG: HNH endonuclease [Candidatus Marinimicrobia bacterium]|nr:HNH endonuclease [Candidatus Neomarinimicrobiota bacterium]MBL7113577.1 HNH endonuclease [Bacteroidales bacterium]
MAKGVLTTKIGSIYDDIPEEKYHFPKTYLNQLKQMVDDWIIYYEPSKTGIGIHGKGRQVYYALARVNSITEEPNKSNYFYAWISDFLVFANPVPLFSHKGLLESFLQKPGGSLNQGAIQRSVRLIPDNEFEMIVRLGFTSLPLLRNYKIAEPEAEYKRDFITSIISRPARDITFKTKVREIYNNTCAVTGLQLFNGGGRPEVEAAHIKPVGSGHNGPDSIRNGIALSRTVHWLFDRGIISLSNEYEIMVASKSDLEQVKHIVIPGKQIDLPKELRFAPHPNFLEYHRENIFKE